MQVSSFAVAPAPEPGLIMVTLRDAAGRLVLLTLAPDKALELGLEIKDTACAILEQSQPPLADEERTHFVGSRSTF